MAKSMERSPLIGNRRAVPEMTFYFLLDGSNVSALPDGSFLNEDNGQILSRL
jgi:hypothetical protein